MQIVIWLELNSFSFSLFGDQTKFCVLSQAWKCNRFTNTLYCSALTSCALRIICAQNDYFFSFEITSESMTKFTENAQNDEWSDLVSSMSTATALKIISGLTTFYPKRVFGLITFIRFASHFVFSFVLLLLTWFRVTSLSFHTWLKSRAPKIWHFFFSLNRTDLSNAFPFIYYLIFLNIIYYYRIENRNVDLVTFALI